ncbi:RAMP superfamily CRISPR-associated protein [Bacilliculturomica massiliensis]|uniref:RAMP superfamily CRISPR-associated protein n=1 Tax=Bacilliculturomica massiliensis TaxID=1917867 RepID=UPI001030CD72|nr:RAMP superfamily CRISPR-associated protein [Bacilliculturomica massiliensis]
MKRWNLQIELKSDFCTTTGEAIPGMLNSKTALEYGIPYIPAKRIKGCLLVAGREMADNGVISQEALFRIFGRPGLERAEGIRVEDGRLSAVPGYLFGRENGEVVAAGEYERLLKTAKERTDIDEQLLEDIFTGKRTRTALDKKRGTAKNHSLRTVQVVPAGILFTSRIEGELGEEEEKILHSCVKGLRHMGIGITRGMGEVRCTLKKIEYGNEEVKESLSILKEFPKETEISLSYEIELEQPVVMAGGQEDGLNQIQASAVSGALAGMYIKMNSLGDSAHEDESFRRIFLRDGVQFGNAFLKRDGIQYVPAPKAFAVPKEDRKAWFNSMAGGQAVRKKQISSQICLDTNGLYLAEPHKEIHFHHARPADRGIGHALNDRAEDTSVPTGQFFHYIALSKGQTFAGSWRGKAEDILALTKCLEAYQYRLRLGTSKTAEYGNCRFRILEAVPVRREHREPAAGQQDEDLARGREWLVWLLSPLVYRSPSDGSYATGSDPLIAQMSKELNSKIEQIDSVCSSTVINGYNSKWRLPAAACPAVSAGSSFHIRTAGDVEAWEIEDMRWGMLTGRGCGQVKAVPWEDCAGGKIMDDAPAELGNVREDKGPSVETDRFFNAVSEYREKRLQQEEAARNALEWLDKQDKNAIPSASEISLLIQMLKGRDGRPRDYEAIRKEAERISGDGKRARILNFMKPCGGKSAEFMKQYLEAAKWKARKREGEDE